MSIRGRKATVIALTVALGACAQRVDAADAFARIRPQGTTLKRVVHEAMARSETFRALVETISRSDGIVYVEEGDCGHGVRACLAAVTVAGSNRILRVKIDTRKADWDLMGSIGHELRHAIEVLSDPTVSNTAAMIHFYLRQSVTTNRLETRAAVQAGEAVRDEVRRSMLAAPAR